ncbi:Shedu anti-phage system protein SduA domain-containing protein [Legionella bozemanae]|uniref:Shedu anti-phage system protein SduA domain-containing protein n=1 Tax=Legionella bozemanae TaxID=447 RepID=UPI00104181A1|nr:Shedu anti-phage system protein SduA domain-containing protein [Legionella bozemanae]
MLLDKLKITSNEILQEYLDTIYKLDVQGCIDKKNKTLLYPTLLLIVKTKEHYILELFGASQDHSIFKIHTINRKTPISTSNYIFQFSDSAHEPVFIFNADRNVVENISFSDPITDDASSSFAYELFEKSYYPQLFRKNGVGGLIGFGDQFKSCALFNCLIRNQNKSFVRVKYILGMIIIDKGIQKSKFQETFRHFLFNQINELRGISLSESKSINSRLLLASFQSLYLVNKIEETVITQFLAKHPKILQQAFNANKIISEKNFTWQILKEEETIRPDFLIQRMDGYWDIIDFKLPLSDKSTITTNPQRNRRFITYVEDGIAQLANYREYFLNDNNLKYLKEHFNIEFNQPNYILVVGHNENVNEEEVKQAARKNRDEIIIVDYDTILSRNLLSLVQN